MSTAPVIAPCAPAIWLPPKWEGCTHYPMPLVGVGPDESPTTKGHQASHALLLCACGWRSVPLRFVSLPIPHLLSQHRAHVLRVAPDEVRDR